MINTKSEKKKKPIIVIGGCEFIVTNLVEHLWTKKFNDINIDMIFDISNLLYKKRQKSSFFDYIKQKYF